MKQAFRHYGRKKADNYDAFNKMSTLSAKGTFENQSILSQMVVAQDESLLRKIEQNEELQRIRQESKQNIKVGDIKSHEVGEAIKNKNFINDQTLPPKHSISLAKTFKIEHLGQDYNPNLEQSTQIV